MYCGDSRNLSHLKMKLCAWLGQVRKDVFGGSCKFSLGSSLLTLLAKGSDSDMSRC